MEIKVLVRRKAPAEARFLLFLSSRAQRLQMTFWAVKGKVYSIGSVQAGCLQAPNRASGSRLRPSSAIAFEDRAEAATFIAAAGAVAPAIRARQPRAQRQ